MGEEQVFRGTVRTGRGRSVGVMSAPEAIEVNRKLTGLPVIPGTLNITLTQPFDTGLLDYFRFSDVGAQLDIRAMGLDFEGEQGFHYGRVSVAGNYPAAIIIFTWNPNPNYAELISPHHLRSTLGLEDGDAIEFTLDSETTGDKKQV
jgi:CTP-dependent riboflavin kinase